MTTRKQIKWPSTEKIIAILLKGRKARKTTRQICIEAGWNPDSLHRILHSRGLRVMDIYGGKVLMPNAIAPIDWDNVAKRLRRGETVKAIYQSLKVSPNTFRRHAKEAGFVINDYRPHKLPPEPREYKRKIDLEKAQKLLDAYFSTARVAQKCGVSPVTVGKYLREGVLKRQPPKEKPKMEKAIQEELKLRRVRMSAPPVIAAIAKYADAPSLMRERYIERLGGKNNAADLIKVAIGEKGIDYDAIETWARRRGIKIQTGQLVTIARGLANASD